MAGRTALWHPAREHAMAAAALAAPRRRHQGLAMMFSPVRKSPTSM
jgi:hypothetical protein